MKELLAELKAKVVEVLGLLDVAPEDITDDTTFFQGGLGLDSVDILELVVMLDGEYGIKIENKELGEKVFINFETLARYVAESRQK
ncbi:MAG: phosphopantetheine-binding protein [Thermodesulfobacteriota bacterium]